MYPILYEELTAGEGVPEHNGLGILSDCISCTIEEERNGIYELTMEYPMNGIHAEDIGTRRIIKAKPNFTDEPQLFRIDRIGKTMNGKFTVYGKHITYDLSGYPITRGTANNIQTAVREVLTPAAGDFTISTTKTTEGEFTITEPSSVKSWLGGKKGSLLDIYGTGEWHYDNFTCTLSTARGQNRDVTIRYGKNLLELSQEINSSNLYTHVLCFYKPSDGPAISGEQVATGLTLDVTKTLIIDCTSDFQETPSPTDLTTKATQYISLHNLTVPSNNITLDFIQSGELTNRVDLCDTVTVYYEALGITRAEVKCIRTKWDCLKEKYIETEFGDAKQNLAGTISDSTATANEAKSDAEAAANSVGSKKRVFTSTPVPPYDTGDLWVRDGAIYYCDTSRAAGYIRLIGETTTPLEEGSEENPIIINGEEYEAQTGDVATYTRTTSEDESISTDYMWDGDSWTEYENYLIYSDWDLATNYVDQIKLEANIEEASEIITGTKGGLVILHCTNPDLEGIGAPDEIIITNDNDFTKNTAKLWRWNAGGLGFSTTGYNGKYTTAITADGKINADLITAGELNAGAAKISDITAAMFRGKTIELGGSESSKLTVKDAADNILVQIDKNGMECFGEPFGDHAPSVLFDKDGVTGYTDHSDRTSKIFWTQKDQFSMKNAIIENETSFGGKIRFVPIDTGTNNGIAIVAQV